MSLRVLGWTAFIFLASGLLVLLFGPREWRSYGCGAFLTAVTLYAVGLFMVARQVASIRRRANEMLERAAQEMEKRKN